MTAFTGNRLNLCISSDHRTSVASVPHLLNYDELSDSGFPLVSSIQRLLLLYSDAPLADVR
jgi:hypothetical protein